MNSKIKSLLICLTPLQILIARRIVELKPSESFDLLVLAQQDNDKYKYYFKNLSNNCNKSTYYPLKGGIYGLLHFLKYYYFNLHHEYSAYSKVYIASIDSIYCQIIVSNLSNSKIYTFDDGTANINTNSIYFDDRPSNLPRKLASRVLGIRYNMKDLKALSIKHYTIYDGLPNITNKTQFISLYNRSSKYISHSIVKHDKEYIAIYLGQPLEEISKEFNENDITRILSKLNIQYYYPHPREKKLPKGEFTIIDSPLIFEDYILKTLDANPHKIIQVFSYISTVNLNISGLDRVETYFIFHPLLFDKFNEFYTLALKMPNVQLIKL